LPLALGLHYKSCVLRIQRSQDGELVTYAVSGRIEEQNVAELERLLDAEPNVGSITFELREVNLVDRDAVRFLAACEERGVKLKNCPSYIRHWIRKGSGIGDEPQC
jgi:hypothetical protein